MALAIILPDENSEPWAKRFTNLDPGLDIRIYPNLGNKDDITMALVWNYPYGILNELRNLKCVASKGAGVDYILADETLPASIPITKIIDQNLVQSMSEYILLAVLNYYRNFDKYKTDKIDFNWKPAAPLSKTEFSIGIMGLGQLGHDTAKKLCSLGFTVNGWSRTNKKIEEINNFFGNNQLDSFLKSTNILVCLLPLTSETENILNKNLFGKLQNGSYIINAARGKHLVDNDLIEAIKSGQLSGACLDVFREEPLPVNHPFWKHPKIIITPHISSLTNPDSVAAQIYENYKRVNSGQQPLNTIDRTIGY